MTKVYEDHSAHYIHRIASGETGNLEVYGGVAKPCWHDSLVEKVIDYCVNNNYPLHVDQGMRSKDDENSYFLNFYRY